MNPTCVWFFYLSAYTWFIVLTRFISPVVVEKKGNRQRRTSTHVTDTTYSILLLAHALFASFTVQQII